MKKALCLITVMVCLMFASMCFASTDEEYVKSLERDALNGDAEAQTILGIRYEDGDGVEQNYAKAREWYEKAANQGHVDAQLFLGIMYEDGNGVRQNFATAKEWYKKACDNGDRLGCGKYKELNEQGY